MQQQLSGKTLRPLLFAGVFALACFGAAVLSYVLSFPDAHFPSIWLPGGLAVAILLRTRYSQWPLYLVGLFLGGWLGSLLFDQPLLNSSLTALTSVLEAATGVWLLRRITDQPGALRYPQQVLALVAFTAILAAAFSAFLTTTILRTIVPGQDYFSIWQIILVSRGLGVLALAPILLIWWDAQPAELLGSNPEKMIEFVVLVVGLFACLLYTFFSSQHRLSYILIPFLVWAALRFGMRGVTVCGLAIIVTANWSAVLRRGASAPTDTVIAPMMVEMSIFLFTTLVTSYILATLWEESRRIETALRESEARHRLLVENQAEGIGIVDANEVFTFANPAAAQIFGVYPETLEGRSLKEFTSPAQFAVVRHQTAMRKARQKTTYEMEITQPGGRQRSLLVTATPQFDSHHQFTGTFALFHDDTDRKQVEITLRDSRARFQTLFDHSPIPIWEEDFSRVKRLIDGLRREGVEDFREFFHNHTEQVDACEKLLRILDVNQAGMQLFDHHDKNEFLSQVPNMVHRGPNEVFIEELAAIAEGKTQFEVEGPNDIIDGVIRYHQVRWMVAPGYEEDYRRVIVSIIDVTERRQAEEKMRYLSTHDVLTGLYNRNFFEAELERLQNSRMEPINVMIVDVNGMKETNDTLGHAAGDDLLRRTAQVLRFSFRKEDIIARIGGDEFVVLFHGNIPLNETITRVKGVLAEHNVGYDGLDLSLSIGAASGSKGVPLIELYKKADQQMYKEKSRSRRSKADGS